MAHQSLKGKLAVVTGASRGIGEAIAEHLAAKGCDLVLGYTSSSSKDAAEALAKALAAKHSVQTLPVQADLGSLDGPAALIAGAKDHFTRDGHFQIDILVNNAGIALNDLLPDVKPADFDATYRVNVRGPLLVTQAVQPHLPRDRSGRVVNVSSVSSSTGFPGQTVYGGSKAALEAMTRSWARELAERATVNAVNPGPVLTEMYARNTDEFKRFIKGFITHTPLMAAREGVDAPELVEDAKTSGGRPAYCSEVAAIIGMLCSEDAGWCTGQVVCANGGMLFGMQ